MIKPRLIGIGVTLGILGGLLLDVYQVSNPAQIVYAAEEEPPREIKIEVRINWTEERIEQLIEEKATEYGVSALALKRVIACESNGSTTIQSNHRYTPHNAPQGYQAGDREESYGLAQFHIPAGNKTKDGKVITKEMAQNPEVAVDTMAFYFSKGLQKKWTCR